MSIAEQLHDANVLAKEASQKKAQPVLALGAECPVLNCPFKRRAEIQQKEITTRDTIIYELKGKIEHFEKRAKDQLSKEDAKEIYKKVVEGKEVDSREQEIKDLMREKRSIQEDLDGFREVLATEKAKVKDILTSVQQDDEYQQQANLNKKLRNENELLTMKNSDFKIENEKLKREYEKIVLDFNLMVEKYQPMKEKYDGLLKDINNLKRELGILENKKKLNTEKFEKKQEMKENLTKIKQKFGKGMLWRKFKRM